MEQIKFNEVDFNNFEIDNDEPLTDVLLAATRKIYLIRKNENCKRIQDELNLILLNSESVTEFVILLIHYRNLLNGPKMHADALMGIAIEDEEEMKKLSINEDPEKSLFGEFTIPEDKDFYADILQSVKEKYLTNTTLNIFDVANVLQAMNMELISNWSTFALMITATAKSPDTLKVDHDEDNN